MGLPAKRLRKAHDSDNEFDYYDDELNVSHVFFFFFLSICIQQFFNLHRFFFLLIENTYKYVYIYVCTCVYIYNVVRTSRRKRR